MIKGLYPPSFGFFKTASANEIRLVGMVANHLNKYLPMDSRKWDNIQKMVFARYYKQVEFLDSKQGWEILHTLGNKHRLSQSKYYMHAPKSHLAVAMWFMERYKEQYTRFWTVDALEIDIGNDLEYCEYTYQLLTAPQHKIKDLI
jgi:hypothetical protein